MSPWFQLRGRLAAPRLAWSLVCILGLLFLAARTTWAADPVSSFDEANKLYEQGKYAEAIKAYDTLLQQKEASAAVYFNLGNACFKAGKTGQAIANYLLAQRLAPRDPDIRANLRFVRETVGTPAPGRSQWQRWLNVITLNQLTLATVALLWLWLLTLAAGELRRDWAGILRPYRRGFGVLSLLMIAWLAIVAQNRLGLTSGVVVVREAIVRFGPLEEAQAFFNARDGAEFTILDRKDTWLQVEDGSRRVGWVRAQDIFVLPRG